MILQSAIVEMRFGLARRDNVAKIQKSNVASDTVQDKKGHGKHSVTTDRVFQENRLHGYFFPQHRVSRDLEK